jgi:uncharacterized protein
VHLRSPEGKPSAGLVLGHGAGGGVAAPDLVATTEVAVSLGIAVALVEQPYRVAGKKSSPRPPVLDAGWTAVVEHLKADELSGLPLILGGRSAGARVACRTANELGAVAVLCLAFPLVAPSGTSRQDELDTPGVPVLVVQGERDRFGVPEPAPGREVAIIRGDHGLKSDVNALRDAVAGWLPRAAT